MFVHTVVPDIQFKHQVIQVLIYKGSNMTVERSWGGPVLLLMPFVTKRAIENVKIKLEDDIMAFWIATKGIPTFWYVWFMKVIDSKIEVFVTSFQNHLFFFFKLMIQLLRSCPDIFFSSRRLKCIFLSCSAFIRNQIIG